MQLKLTSLGIATGRICAAVTTFGCLPLYSTLGGLVGRAGITRKVQILVNRAVIALFLLALAPSVSNAQIQVSVGFEKGFIGEYQNNAHQPDNGKLFSSLGIVSAVISDSTNNGLFGGTQGNDYTVQVTFLYSNGSKVSFPAAVNWRDTSGSTIHGIGLIGVDLSGNAIANPVDGSSYLLSSNRKKTYLLQFLGSSRIYTESGPGQSVGGVSGNAATNGLLDDLNSYVIARPVSTTPSALTATISAANSQIFANGTSTTVITIQLKDANGNNITTGGYPVTLTTSAGTLLGSLVDNNNGTYTQTLQSSSNVEVATLTGTLDADGALGSNSPAAITDDAQVGFIAVVSDTAAPVVRLVNRLVT